MPRNRTPLREQSFRLSILLILPVVVFIGTAALLIPRLTGPNGLDGTLVVALFAGAGVLMVLAIVGGLALGQKVLVRDRIEVAFRRPGEKWRHARLTVRDGGLELQRYFWQLRIPVGEPMPLQVRSVGEDEGRRPTPRMWWSLNPQLRIVDLRTDQGDFELAALPSHLAELRERLAFA